MAGAETRRSWDNAAIDSVPIEPPAAEAPEWRQGWPVVLAATIGFGCTLGMFSLSAGLFIAPMRAEHDWPMSVVAFAPIVTLVMSLMMPLGGVAIDRFGARPVAIFGLLLFAAAYLALALLPLNLPTIYAVAACLGILGPAGNSGPYVRGVATWFRSRTGSAFGVMLSGTSVAGVVFVPIVAIVIDRFGWRAGYLALAAIMLGVALPLILWLFRENPAAKQSAAGKARNAAGQTLGQTFVDIRFWLLMLSLGLAALPMGAFLSHLQPLLHSQSFSLPVAAGFGSLFALAIGIGRVGGGLLIDRLWDYGVTTTVLVIAAIGCFSITSLSPDSPYWVVAVTIAAIGLAYGAEVDFGAYFSLKLFGLRDFSKIFGFKSLVVGGGVALGGIMSSALFDLTGSYGPLGLTTGILFLLSATAMLTMGIRDRRSQGADRDREIGTTDQ